MRVIWSIVLFGLCQAQFDFFSRPSYEDSYNSLSDAIGVKDAIGLWGRAVRNLITRHKLPPGSLNHREYTIKPEVSDIEALRNVQTQGGGNDKIINEKILYALLPRIKGQSAFTTTPLPTKPTTSLATSTTKATTASSAAPLATKKPPTTKIVKKKKMITKSTVRTEVASPTATTEATTEETTEETTGLPLPKSKDGGGPQFTVVFRTKEKEILEAKKAGVEVSETDFNTDKESETTTVEEEERTTTVPKKTTVKTVSKKPAEQKEAEQTKQKKEAETKRTTSAPTTKHVKQDDVVAKNVLKQKELMDDDDVPTTVWSEETTEAPIEGSGERDVIEATEPTLLSQDTTKAAKKKTETEKTTTKKPTTTPKKKEDKTEKMSEKKEKETKKAENKKEEIKVEKKEEKKEKPKVDKKKEEQKKTQEQKKKEQTKNQARSPVKKPPTSKEVEAQIEKEATEILELLNKPVKDKRQELSRKLLFEKLRDYLAQQESTTIEPKVTTTAATTTLTIANDEETTETSTVKPNNKDTFALPLTTEDASEIESTTIAISTTTEAAATTEETEVKKTFSVKKSLRIPEAEEDDPNLPAFVQEIEKDPAADSTTVTAVETTTTLTRATPASASSASPGGTVYNLNANSNSDTHPVLTNVMTPIAGILDGISPILVPLLSTTGQAARARARGIRTYEPTGKDIMVDSPGETSIVGFGTQLAREILSPGILKRERQARERAMAVKIEEARRARENKSLFATIFDVARTGPPLELPIISTPKPALYNLGQQALSYAPAQQAQAISNYVPAPPPGYSGPPAPPPPPPPPGFIPRGYNGPIPDAFRPTNSPVLQIDGASDQTRNTPYYPPVLETSTFKNDEGYQMGRSGVSTTFQQDSGLQMAGGNGIVSGDQVPQNMPEIMIAPADDSAPSSPPFSGGGSASGFGGGRKPTGSFEEAEKNSRMDTSFITARRKRL